MIKLYLQVDQVENRETHQNIGTYSRYYAENSFWIVNIENLECTYLNGDKCRHFYVFKSFFIQCNYLLVRGYPMFYPLCIQIHVCHVGSTHVRTNRLFLIPRTNINYSQTIRTEYRKYLFIRSTGVQPLRSSNWEHWAIHTSSTQDTFSG